MHKKVAPTVLHVINSICLAMSSVMIIMGGIMQWGQTVLRITIIPGIFVMVAKGYGGHVFDAAHVAIVADSYMTIISKAGLIIFIIGTVLSNVCSIGIIGVCCRKGIIIILYIVLACVLVLCIMIIIIIFLIKKDEMQRSLGDILQKTLVEGYKFHERDPKPTPDFSGMIDIIQMRAKCCGSYDGKDYRPISKTAVVPYSCCIMNGTDSITPLHDDCTYYPNDGNSYFSNGCSSIFWVIIAKFSQYATYCLVGLGLLLLVLISMAVIILKCCGKKGAKAKYKQVKKKSKKKDIK